MYLTLALVFALASAQSSHLIVSRSPIATSCADFLGPYGTEGEVYHLYRAQLDCVSATISSTELVFAPFPADRKLIYVQEVAVAPDLRGEESPFLPSLENIVVSGTQTTFITSATPDFEIVYGTNTSALLSVSSDIADHIDMYLPRFVVPIRVHTSSTYTPVPDSDRRRVLDWLNNLSYKSQIDNLVNFLSVDYIRSHVKYLTGESSGSDLLTRYATSTDARRAARYLKTVFEENGAECEFHEFLATYSPNVICRYSAASANPEGTIILGAHYDSRALSMTPYVRAPGANDDGSGIGSLVGISRVIKEQNITFSNNIELVAFCAEEQGLIGSSYYARRLREDDAKVLLMIQADMIGYRRKDENPQIAFPARYATDEASLYLKNLTQLYSKELEYGDTYACCSDHQSFFSEGFASTQVFERTGGIADPMYHNGGDLTDRPGYDFEQIRSIAKVTFSAILDTSLSSFNAD